MSIAKLLFIIYSPVVEIYRLHVSLDYVNLIEYDKETIDGLSRRAIFA
jgi:hypothetical protein